jgi:hypothetical protein
VLWAFGLEAMHQLTHDYKTIMTALDFSDLPYWDLCAALRPISSMSTWTDDLSAQQTMRDRHAVFAEQAFQQIEKLR